MSPRSSTLIQAQLVFQDVIASRRHVTLVHGIGGAFEPPMALLIFQRTYACYCVLNGLKVVPSCRLSLLGTCGRCKAQPLVQMPPRSPNSRSELRPCRTYRPRTGREVHNLMLDDQRLRAIG